MPKRTDRELVSDIQEAIRRVMDYTSSMTYEAFLADTKTQDAVVRNLEIIGEAAKNLSENLRAKRADIPWKGMTGIRDKLIHHYFGINLDIVWQVVTHDLPTLTEPLTKIGDEELR